ncbi:MAG: thiamine-phosphate kinase [Gemmatimonadota bacterium]
MTPAGEFGRIERMLAASRRLPVPDEIVVGAGDDAAVIRPPEGESLVLSSDLSIEGVHFERGWLTWDAIGYRATVAALSDLAAMAARPLGALVSVALPPELDAGVYAELAEGVTAALEAAGAALLGGDTSSSPGPALLDVVVVGSTGAPVLRSGARPGDELWVTGRLGGAAAAVLARRAQLEPHPAARRRFDRPPVRWREARWLAERGVVTAAIDLSDGLAGDARHLARASGVGLLLEPHALPLHEVLEGWADDQAARTIAAGGGEDYELLFSSPAGAIGASREEWKSAFDVDLTRVGRVIEGDGVAWIDRAGEPVDPPAAAGFDHFGGAD